MCVGIGLTVHIFIQNKAYVNQLTQNKVVILHEHILNISGSVYFQCWFVKLNLDSSPVGESPSRPFPRAMGPWGRVLRDMALWSSSREGSPSRLATWRGEEHGPFHMQNKQNIDLYKSGYLDWYICFRNNNTFDKKYFLSNLNKVSHKRQCSLRWS